jgi:hypothetical protein
MHRVLAHTSRVSKRDSGKKHQCARVEKRVICGAQYDHNIHAKREKK